MNQDEYDKQVLREAGVIESGERAEPRKLDLEQWLKPVRAFLVACKEQIIEDWHRLF